MPGPVPKRSDQRRRRNTDAGPALVKAKTASKRPTVPRGDDDWHPIAKRWYADLRKSGQADFYEASDWATAVYVAEAMSRNLSQARFSAQLFQSVMSAMTDLLTTEGSRRRARVELERETGEVDEHETARLTVLDGYRQAAAGGADAGT